MFSFNSLKMHHGSDKTICGSLLLARQKCKFDYKILTVLWKEKKIKFSENYFRIVLPKENVR